MKSFLLSLPFSVLFLLASALPASAQINICPSQPVPGANFSALCSLSFGNIGTVITRIIIILLVAAAVIALFFLIWGGIKWILSGGDKTAVEGARNTIIAAIIGLAVTFLAFFIIQIIGGLFGVKIDDLNTIIRITN